MDLPDSIPVIVDRAAAAVADFVCGGNRNGTHYRGANWERDARITRIADIRKVVKGDPSPDGKGTLKIARGIEVGHVFQLGQKYAEAMGATVLDEQGKACTVYMGCYGIGVSRIVAAAIEQNHDERGIIWPAPLAPFDVALLPLNMHKSEKLQAEAGQLYDELTAAGYALRPVDPEALLAAHPAPRIVAVVHAETSTGVRSDIAALGDAKGDALLLVDCVTSLGGIVTTVNPQYTADELHKARMILWKGHCSVHGRFSEEVVDELREAHRRGRPPAPHQGAHHRVETAADGLCGRLAHHDRHLPRRHRESGGSGDL